MVSEPTYWALCCRGIGCLSSVETYLPVTVLQRCRLFKRCWNLPARHCGAGCSLFKRCWSLPAGQGRGAGCLSGVSTYLPCTVGQGFRLFKRCWNLPAGHCVAGVQAV